MTSGGLSRPRVSGGATSHKWPVFAGFSLLALIVDLVTKWLVMAHLRLGEVHEVLAFLNIQYVENQGVSFGLLSGRTTLIVVVAGFAVAVIFLYVLFERRTIPAGLGGGLLVGGSAGNFIERAWAGRVTDFIKLPYWPNFNFADVFIVVGVGIIAVFLVADIIRGDVADSS